MARIPLKWSIIVLVICSITEAAIFLKNDEEFAAQRPYDGYKEKARERYNEFLTKPSLFAEKLFRLRGLKVPSADPSLSHVMKIRFPRKHLQKIVQQAHLGQTTSTQLSSPVVPAPATPPKHPDYIEIDDVLRINDPSEFTFDRHNRLDDVDIKRIKKLAPDAEKETATETTLANESQATANEQPSGSTEKTVIAAQSVDENGAQTEVSLGATNENTENMNATEESKSTDVPSVMKEESKPTEVPSSMKEESTSIEVPSVMKEESTSTEAPSTVKDESTSTEVPSSMKEESKSTEVNLGAMLSIDQPSVSSQSSDQASTDISTGNTDSSTAVPEDRNNQNTEKATTEGTNPRDAEKESTPTEATNLEKSDVKAENVMGAVQFLTNESTTTSATRSAADEDKSDEIEKAVVSESAEPMIGSVQVNQEIPVEVKSATDDTTEKTTLSETVDSVAGDSQTTEQNMEKQQIASPEPTVGDAQEIATKLVEAEQATEATVGDVMRQQSESGTSVSDTTEPMIGSVQDMQADEKSAEVAITEKSDNVSTPMPVSDMMVGDAQNSQSEQKVENVQKDDALTAELKEKSLKAEDCVKTVENVSSVTDNVQDTLSQGQETLSQVTTASVGNESTETATKVDARAAEETTTKASDNDESNDVPTVEPIIGDAHQNVESQQMSPEKSDKNVEDSSVISSTEPTVGDVQKVDEAESTPSNESGVSVNTASTEAASTETALKEPASTETASAAPTTATITASTTAATTDSTAASKLTPADPDVGSVQIKQNDASADSQPIATNTETPSPSTEQTTMALGISVKTSSEDKSAAVEDLPKKSTDAVEKTIESPPEDVKSPTTSTSVPNEAGTKVPESKSSLNTGKSETTTENGTKSTTSNTPKTAQAQLATKTATEKPAVNKTDGIHPLIKRIMLGSPTPANNPKPFQKFIEHIQNRSPLLASLFQLRPFGQPPQPTAAPPTQKPIQRRKKNVKRDIDGSDLIITPKPFEPFDLLPGQLAAPAPVPRLSLLEKYHAMNSGEKAQELSKGLERVMHGLTILGHVDGYLTHRVKTGLKKAHKIFQSSEEAQA